MIERAADILRHTFGYVDFRGQQREIITTILDGQDALVLMPTGGGKSLCYQLPSLVLPGMGIIVSPLIALMQDQVNALLQLGIKAAYLNSTLTAQQQGEVMRSIYDGEIDLLYIAPERLLKDSTLNRLMSVQVSLIAIDEAHCVSQWGHDFRVDYLGLQVLKQAFPNVPRIALTATADQRTRNEIVARLDLNEPKLFVSSFDRPNIRYQVQTKGDAKNQLAAFMQQYKNQAGIVYCMTRARVDGIAEWLRQKGYKALAYHAGLSSEEREQHLQAFLRDDAVVMVATIAFGMGIDKPDVRFVAHLDLPKSMEAYYQETGRAGRDGKPSTAWMVYGLQDVVRLGKMVQESNANEQIKRIEQSKIEALLAWCEATTCRRRSLLQYFGEQSEAACGNCDVCLSPPKTWNATEDAQKLLSNIYRLGQRFGAGHVIDVLRGKSNQRITNYRHHQLSTYGIGESRSDKQWRSIIRQLIVQQYLWVNDAQYGAIQLTEKARSLIKGEVQLFLREDAVDNTASRGTSQRARRQSQTVSEQDRQLWEALRECRKRLADEQGVPPFHIFHDASLMEMMQGKPKSKAELLEINGVGEVKLERYGDAFLAVLNDY